MISEESEAEEALGHFHFPVVVKADGLAAGKGVVIAKTEQEAHAAIAGLFSGQLLGAPERSVLIEEFLDGEELSFLVISDGTMRPRWLAAQDHKRIGEGDTGPNTGGMGVYSTDAMLSPELRDWIMHHIVQPTLDGMRAEDAPFVGVLYLRADDDSAWTDGAGVQRALRRSGDAGDPDAAGFGSAGGDGGRGGRAALRNGAAMETRGVSVCDCELRGLSGALPERAADYGAGARCADS